MNTSLQNNQPRPSTSRLGLGYPVDRVQPRDNIVLGAQSVPDIRPLAASRNTYHSQYAGITPASSKAYFNNTAAELHEERLQQLKDRYPVSSGAQFKEAATPAQEIFEQHSIPNSPVHRISNDIQSTGRIAQTSSPQSAPQREIRIPIETGEVEAAPGISNARSYYTYSLGAAGAVNSSFNTGIAINRATRDYTAVGSGDKVIRTRADEQAQERINDQKTDSTVQAVGSGVTTAIELAGLALAFL